MFVIKKKHFIAFIIVIFAVITILFSTKNDFKKSSADYPVGQVKKVSGEGVIKSSKFDELRKERENARKDVIENLNDVINNAAADITSRHNASDKINEICDLSLKENVCEELIKLKGYSDVIVFIDKDSVNVYVDTENLKSEDVIIIKDIITDKTNNNNIKIVAVN